MASSWKISAESLAVAGDNPFSNNVYGYRSTVVALADGRNATYHGVLIGACLHVVAVDEDLTTYFVRQSRPNARAHNSGIIPQTLELPGGFKHPDVDEITAANNELAEEIGKRAHSLQRLGVLYPSPGISNETDTIFLGTGLSAAQATGSLEATEQDLEVVTEPFGKIYSEMLHGTQPAAAQTLAAMAMAATQL